MINVFLKKSSGFLIATFLCLTGAIAQNSPTTPNLRTESTRQSNAFRIISDLAGEATSESSNLASHEASELASKHNFITFSRGSTYILLTSQKKLGLIMHMLSSREILALMRHHV